MPLELPSKVVALLGKIPLEIILRTFSSNSSSSFKVFTSFERFW